MAAMSKMKEKERKIGVVVMLTNAEIAFLDRKIDKDVEQRKSRSSMLRSLIHKAMLNPGLLDVK